MRWQKKGLIYKPSYTKDWRNNSALTPTALIINENIIRVYASFRDINGIGRIGYIDVNANNPIEIVKVSDKPVLDIGNPGMFDDNGVILGDLIRIDGIIYMYYVGFQLCKNVKFLAFSGLAVSQDNGETFKRYRNTPILDRADEALFIRAIHSVVFEDNKFKFWYATGNGWEYINGIPYPQYDINYIESKNGLDFPDNGIKCLKTNKENLEYRIGRPRIYKMNGQYVMNFTYGSTDGRYIAGQAVSSDGINWIREDKDLGIELSKSGWDSIHLCYPSIISFKNKTYMFYNGNNFGFGGIGYAELITD